MPYSARKQPKVLVVDDSPTDRMRLKKMLEDLGYQVTEAINGQVAIEILTDQPIPLVISDKTMPVMNGHEFCRRIRDDDALGQPYVIMLTAADETSDLVAGMDAGADDFLRKPCDKEELRVRLAAGVRMVQMREEIESRNDELSLAVSQLQAAKAQTDEELALAATLQQEYVPESNWLSPGLQLATQFEMTRGIGGDSMGTINISADQVLLYQLDVMGHGIASAMLSFTLQNAIQQMLGGYLGQSMLPPLHQFARRLNERFPSEKFSGLYFTFFIALIDEKENKLSYCQAGHPHPTVLSPKGELLQLTRGSFPIGLFEFSDYETRTLPFLPGSVLMVSSDGLFDVENLNQESLGRSAVETLIQQHQSESAEEILARIVNRKTEWQGSALLADDLSVMLVKRSQGISDRQFKYPFKVTLKPEPASLHAALASLETHFKLIHAEELLINRIMTSMAELLNNFAEHATWPDEISEAPIEMAMIQNETWTTFHIAEYSNPIPHLCPPRPIDLERESGRGIHIMMSWIDQIRTERKNGCNYWTLKFLNKVTR